ncbi:MAG: ABC transporter substrate-binding protein [Hyphomicrobiaceae bacterium]|nr:ABC transporter substrate-binding protein [Hyphomicrobiaceae bacterium]
MRRLGRAAPAACAIAVFGLASLGASAETPKRGGTLQFAVTAEPADYDCHASQTFALLHPISPFYSFLVRYDASQGGKITGDLAKSWEISKDGLTYTFKLHEGVKFHDGSPLTSADVKFSFERIKSPPTGVVSLRKSLFEDVVSIDAPDPATVVFKIKEPNASMLDNLAQPFNCIYSKAKVEKDARFPVANIVGSGAFQFVEYVRGSHMTAKRFDGYFQKDRPYLDGYKAFFVKSGAVVPGMIGGQFDAEFRGRTPAERDQLLKAGADRWTVHEGPWGTVDIIIFNTRKKPFDDVRVRRALSLAIDRWNGNEQLSKVTLVKATGGFLRPGYDMALSNAELEKIPGYWRDIESSRAEAKRLLKEAGAENLKIKLHNRTLDQPYTPAGVFVIDQWRRIGVNVEHSQVETKAYFGNLVGGDFDVALYPVTVAADNATEMHQSHLTNEKSPISYARHNDKKLDELWDRQTRELDPAKRKALIQEFETRVLTEAYSLSLHWWQRIIVYNKKVKGWNFSSSHFQGNDLVNVWLDQ